MGRRACKADQVQLIEGYELLLKQLSAMQQSADACDWDTLIDQECHYLVDSHSLRDMEQKLAGEMDPDAQVDKVRLSREIVARSVQVSRSLVARRDTLRRLIAAERAESVSTTP